MNQAERILDAKLAAIRSYGTFDPFPRKEPVQNGKPTESLVSLTDYVDRQIQALRCAQTC